MKVNYDFWNLETCPLWLPEFLDCDGFTSAKEKGLLHLEGKEYVVRDREIVHPRFNM